LVKKEGNSGLVVDLKALFETNSYLEFCSDEAEAVQLPADHSGLSGL
jgi:hypothetical protein